LFGRRRAAAPLGRLLLGLDRAGGPCGRRRAAHEPQELSPGLGACRPRDLPARPKVITSSLSTRARRSEIVSPREADEPSMERHGRPAALSFIFITVLLDMLA